ncbi:MAG: type I restriction endonuclease subunit R, EcoR124 family, partial [Bacteroidota bacterium]
KPHLNDHNSQGNTRCFRNLKEATDEAVALFSNKNAQEDIFLPPYEKIAEKFDQALKNLRLITPTYQSVDELPSETEEGEFILAFRALMRVKNVLGSYTDFDWDDLGMDEQEFEDYKSKYLDLYDKVRSSREKKKESVLEEIDFELELIHREEINVAYILKLLAQLKASSEEAPMDAKSLRKAIIDLIGGEMKLRSKKELIEQFIDENLPRISDLDSITDEFEKYWQEQKVLALHKLCEEENLDEEQFKALIDTYIFSGQEPIKEDIYRCMANRPSILQARSIGDRIIARMREYVEVFVMGVA